MRLLLVASEFPPGPGGIGAHAYHLARQLSRMAWEVVVAAPQPHVSPADAEEFNSHLPFKVVSLGKSALAVSALATYARPLDSLVDDINPDILLASGDSPMYLTDLLASRKKLPWIAVEHGRRPPNWELWLKKRACARASAVVCVSEFTKRELTAMGVHPKSVEVIRNGGDTTVFRVLTAPEINEARKQYGIQKSRVILTVGEVSDHKGQEVVIRAMPAILKTIPNAVYLCVGIPTEQGRFEKLAASLGVSDQVHFLGQVAPERLVRLMNCADVFALTSRRTKDRWEGFGIAVVEAALCGLPAVVAADCGLEEAIDNGVTGVAVPQDTPEIAAHAVLALLADETLRLRLGLAARDRAVRSQTWRNCAIRYDAILRRIGRGALVDDDMDIVTSA